MKKVLLITGIPVRTDTNSGKTFLTLFKDYKKEELAQLYFSPQSPNIDMCSTYYQLCEKQMLNSFFGIFKGCGRVVEPIVTTETNACYDRNLSIFTRYHNNVLFKIAREILWDFSNWKNKEFNNWIQYVKPDVIFAIMHDTNGATKAVRWIAKKLDVPVVLYVTDDYYNDQEISKNPIRKIYYALRKRENKKLVPYIKEVIGCSDNATDYFKKALNIQRGQTIYTPSSEQYLEVPLKHQNLDEIIKIRYFGNLGLGRWEVLRELGKVIQAINENEKKAMLEVYSTGVNEKIIDELSIKNGSKFNGWVHGKEYLDLLQDADIAVHVESFDDNMIRRTWLSISTKVADYLGAGKCILAIGSKELASMDHIKTVACTITDLKLLRNKVEEIITDYKLRDENQNKARMLALKEHDIKIVSKKIRDILE